MEKITINSFEKKAAKNGKPFWVVKYMVAGNQGVYDATIGAWDSQLADYIEKDVGVGGTVSVVIEQKGDYTNITGVDMTSGVKGVISETEEKPVSQDNEKWRTPNQIVANELTHAWAKAQNEEKSPSEVWTAYNFFLENL